MEDVCNEYNNNDNRKKYYGDDVLMIKCVIYPYSCEPGHCLFSIFAGVYTTML